MIDLERIHIDAGDRLDYEVSKIVLRHPLAQVGRHEVGLAAVALDKSGHLSSLSDSRPKSDRLLGLGEHVRSRKMLTWEEDLDGGG